MAATIPGARYVSLSSAHHLVLEQEPAWQMLLDELALFLGWERTPVPVRNDPIPRVRRDCV